MRHVGIFINGFSVGWLLAVVRSPHPSYWLVALLVLVAYIGLNVYGVACANEERRRRSDAFPPVDYGEASTQGRYNDRGEWCPWGGVK